MQRIRAPKKDTLICAGLCFVTALISLGFYMLQDGGAFTLREDFDFQQLPFTMALHNQIARGGLAGWCWNLDLGASAIQGFGFYELGSPFFWLSMLFPSAAFPYVVGWIYILKYTVAGITAHLYIRRFVKSPGAATIGALLYAFSGFQTTNLLFYHFHDVVALFPLLLIGLERLMENRRDWHCFVLAVFVNALVNYFFFVQSTVFLIIYFAFRFGPTLKRETRLLRSIGLCLALGILGVAMAGALLVPSFVYMLTNPRAGGWSASGLVWDPWQFLFQIQGFLMPADVMHDHNAIVWQQWTSTSCWLPMVGASLALAYMRKRRDWLTYLFIALLIICLSPILTSGFTLFKNVYQRWWYMLVLMGALASACVVDEPKELDARFGAKALLALDLLFVVVVVVGSQVLHNLELFHADRFALYAAIALAGAAATYALVCPSLAGNERRMRTLAGCVCAFSACTTALTLGIYRQNLYTGELLDNISETEQRAGTLNEIALGTQLQVLDPQFRYATGDNRLTLPGNAAGLSSFSSTVSAASGQFDELFDTPATNVWHLNKALVPGLPELLGGRYCITTDPGEQEVVDQHVVDGTTYYVVAQDACPLGVVFDRFVIDEDVRSLPREQRALALMQAPVVAQADAELAGAYAERVSTNELDLTQSVGQLARQAQAQAVRDFWRNDYGFGFTAAVDVPSLVYVAVPHDSGWTALVDGAPARIVDSSGMMLLPLEQGAHEVAFAYETPGLTVGIVASCVAWAAFGAAAIVSKRR